MSRAERDAFSVWHTDLTVWRIVANCPDIGRTVMIFPTSCPTHSESNDCPKFFGVARTRMDDQHHNSHQCRLGTYACLLRFALTHKAWPGLFVRWKAWLSKACKAENVYRPVMECIYSSYHDHFSRKILKMGGVCRCGKGGVVCPYFPL